MTNFHNTKIDDWNDIEVAKKVLRSIRSMNNQNKRFQLAEVHDGDTGGTKVVVLDMLSPAFFVKSYGNNDTKIAIDWEFKEYNTLNKIVNELDKEETKLKLSDIFQYIEICDIHDDIDSLTAITICKGLNDIEDDYEKPSQIART